MQYAATPELAAWREGTRLCLAKSLGIADVVEIGTPREESVVLSENGGDATLRTVTAQLVMRTTDTAPWLEQADLQAAALAQIDDWEYTNARLQKRHPVTFRLRDGQWAAGYAQRDEMHKPCQASQRASTDQERIDSLDSTRGFFTGLRDTLSGMFSFGGHPLTGTWRMDADGVIRSLGMCRWTWACSKCTTNASIKPTHPVTRHQARQPRDKTHWLVAHNSAMAV